MLLSPPNRDHRTTRWSHLLVALAVAALGCSSPSGDWETAVKLNTVEAYEQYLSQHPTSDSASVARARLVDLRWQQAQAEGIPELYQELLNAGASPQMTAAVQANLDMAGQFHVDTVETSNVTRLHCLQSGGEVLLNVTSQSNGSVAILSKLTTQAQLLTGRWIDPAGFVIESRRGVAINDKLLLNSCMTDRGPVAEFVFDYLPGAEPQETGEDRSAMKMVFSDNARLRLRLLYETDVDQLRAIRVFGTTVPLHR